MDKHWSGNMFRLPLRKSNRSPRGDNGLPRCFGLEDTTSTSGFRKAGINGDDFLVMVGVGLPAHFRIQLSPCWKFESGPARKQRSTRDMAQTMSQRERLRVALKNIVHGAFDK
jgi:hypothetical protein